MPLSPIIERHRIHWDKDDPASQGLLEPMFDDMGIGDEGTWETQMARAAVKEYCSDLIKNGLKETAVYTMGEIQMCALHYYQGYMECLANNRENKRLRQ